MLHYIVNKDFDSIIMQILIIFIACVVVVLSAFIDLIFAVRIARSQGKASKSYGFRRTCNKLLEYLSFMFFMIFIDVLNPVFSYFEIQTLPLMTIGGAIFLVYTEWKSVREKSSDNFKYSIENNPVEMINFIKDNADAIKALLENKKK